jgi:hypothetical protein
MSILPGGTLLAAFDQSVSSLCGDKSNRNFLELACGQADLEFWPQTAANVLNLHLQYASSKLSISTLGAD